MTEGGRGDERATPEGRHGMSWSGRRQFVAGVGSGHAYLLSSKGQDGVSLFRAPLRGRARGAAGGRIAAARLARLIARARRRTHLARRFPPGLFSAPAIAFCRKAERRPRKPPLSTFILHHTAKCQPRRRELFQQMRTKHNFSATPARGLPLRGRRGCGRGPDRLPSADKGGDRERHCKRRRGADAEPAASGRSG